MLYIIHIFFHIMEYMGRTPAWKQVVITRESMDDSDCKVLSLWSPCCGFGLLQCFYLDSVRWGKEKANTKLVNTQCQLKMECRNLENAKNCRRNCSSRNNCIFLICTVRVLWAKFPFEPFSLAFIFFSDLKQQSQITLKYFTIALLG